MSETTTVREKPILFRGEMVNAILDGRKTQTRRLMKPQPRPGRLGNGEIIGPCEGQIGGGDYHVWQPPHGCQKHSAIPLTHSCMYRIEPECPYGEIGDHLWVRETWQKSGFGWGNNLPAGKVHYRATDNGEWKPYWGNWKPSIHMPRWACRLVLEITDVRVERLNDITPEDAVAEGIEEFARKHRLSGYWTTAFSRLWESINGVGSWAANPFVWVVSFRRIEL